MTKPAVDPILGIVKGPGAKPHEFVFLTSDNASARIGEFVYYLAEDEKQRRILGTITERRLVRSLPDEFYSDPTVSPRSVAELIGLAPEDDLELFEISVETIGFFSRPLGTFVNPRIPPAPGDRCFLAGSKTLSETLSSKKPHENGAANLGSLLTRPKDEVPVVLSVKDAVSTHLAILASTGSGKSYTAGVFTEELLAPHNRAAVLIVDPHGEYHTLKSIEADARFTADGYKPEVSVFTPDRIKVRFSSLTESDIRYLLPEGTSDKMSHILRVAYRTMLEKQHVKNGLWGYFDLRDAVKEQMYEGAEPSNQSSVEGLLWRLDSRFDRKDGIFSDNEHIPLTDLYKPGRCTILQLSEIEQSEQQVIVATLLRRINKARMATVRGETRSSDESVGYPVFTLIEEAHRFAPAGASVVSTNVLKQILSEGRKFGVGIGLISQRPGKLDQDVLSQCMTQIIMRIVNPIDQQTIAQSVEGAGRALLDELPALSKGQAIISGVGINTPVLCRVRERLTKHGGETFDAPTEWLNWFSESETRSRKIEEAPYLKETDEKEPEIFGDVRI